MPIVHMTSDYEKAASGGKNVHLYRDSYLHTTLMRYSDGAICLNLNENIPVEDQPKDGYEYTPVVWLYETHHGVCIHEREHNGYNDSDFYMVVWDEETQQPKSIEFASTRGWSYPCYASRPDATPEVMAKFNSYEEEQRRKQEAEHNAWLLRQPAKGKTLKVVRGRKVPKGLLGVCIWIGSTQFGKRCGLKTESGEVFWTALSNVEVVC